MAFGADVITFTSYNPPAPGAGFPDDEGTFSPLNPSVAMPSPSVPGCHHRPYRQTERGPGGARAEYPMVGVGFTTDWWQSTCPPVPAALATKAGDTLTVRGQAYRVIMDAKPSTDGAGRILKVSILSEQQAPTA